MQVKQKVHLVSLCLRFLPMFFVGVVTVYTYYFLYCLYSSFASRLTLRFQRRLDIQQVCDLWVPSHPVAFAEVFFIFTSYPWENIWTSHVDLPQRCLWEWLEIELHRTRTLSLNIDSQWRLLCQKKTQKCDWKMITIFSECDLKIGRFLLEKKKNWPLRFDKNIVSTCVEGKKRVRVVGPEGVVIAWCHSHEGSFFHKKKQLENFIDNL